MRKLAFGIVITILASAWANAQIPSTERQALLDLYTSTNGASWLTSTNWLGSAGTECTWFGVSCDTGGTQVTKLDLHSNNLSGTLPASLGNLTNLQALNLVTNQLSGSIPAQLGNLTNLQFIHLHGNQLTGSIPAELGSLTSLQWAQLSDNYLSGTIPPQLGSLINLISLDLRWNQLSGSIPPEIGGLTNLQILGLQGNQLSGSIPPELGSLTALQALELDGNHLSGSIPSQLGRLAELQSLTLSNNQLTGMIPPQLGSLTSLQFLHLENNQLSGSIPPELGNLTSLQYIDLHCSQLSGSIPPELGNLTKLQTARLFCNNLTGGIPPELGKLTNLRDLELSNGQLGGSIPPEFGNLTNLQYLDLTGSQLSGSIPPELGNLTNLQTARLFCNNLTGGIPPELGRLTNLRDLELSNSQLGGSIPPELGNLTNLQYLDLTGSQLSGSIPPELGNLTNLQVLQLSLNRLTGNIPRELGRLTSLQTLQLDRNQLSGGIPAELGSLSSLQLLYLSSNQLSGSIPLELTNLISLAQGDFRWNALYSTDPALTSFLTAKEGGNWQSTQTIAPANPSISGTTAGSITVSWNPIAYTADGGYYQVWYSTTAGGPYTPFATTTSSKSDSSLTVTGLTTNTTYYFVVSTTTQRHSNNNNVVTSGFSAEVAGTAAASSPSVNAFTASPSTIIEGQSSTLSWTTSNATTVSISGVTEAQPANGSVSVTPTITTTYTLTATGPDGTATATATVVVNPAVPVVIVSFAASPPTINGGQSSTLSWTTTNATAVSISGIGTQPVSGSITVSPATSTTYELTASGPGASATADVTVKVLGPFSRLQLLLPGEIAVPGTPTGKAGAPATQVSGTPFPVVVNGVDASFNVVTTATDTVGFTGSDPGATLPPSAPLVAGSRSSTVTLAASAGQTITASDLSDSNKGPSTSPSIAVIALNDPAVAVASFPAGLVATAGTAGATDSYALVNTGGAPTTITLKQSGNFFTQSPTSFTLQPGAPQVITLSGFAQPAGVYEGAAIPSGLGVPSGLTVPVRLLSATPLAGAVGAAPTASRTEVSGPVGTNPTGTVAFMNSGSATLLGILISDAPWLIPEPGVISIPPGQTVTVSFTIDRSKEPTGGTVGSTTGELTLVFVPPTGAGALWERIAQDDSTPQLGRVSVSIVDVAKPPVAPGTIPPLGVGEVALVVGGLRHGSGVEADLAIVNAGSPTPLNDLKLHYVSQSASQASPLGQLPPNISASLADVVKSVFGHDGETGGVLLRSSSIDLVSMSAMRLVTSSPRGTYAGALPVFRSDRAMAAGDTVFLAGLKKENGFHTNFCLQEVGGAAGAVKVEFLDADGTPIGTSTAALPPFGFLEIADAAPAGAMAARIASLGPSQSRIVAYGLAIDEATGDSWSLVDWNGLYGAPATDPVVLPLVGGGAGARVQTDLALVNKTSAVNPVALKYTTNGSRIRRHIGRDSGSSIGRTATTEALIEGTQTITLGPLNSTTISDLLSTRFAVSSDSIGYLTITPAAGVAITARTYTKSSDQPGTSGAGIAAIPFSSMLLAGQAKYFAGIEDASAASVAASAPATYRTNLGLIETAGQGASVRVTVRYYLPAGLVAAGYAENTEDFTLSPGQILFVADVMKAIIGDARNSFGTLRNVQFEVRVTGGNGRVLPFIQSIDNGTGDTILRTD